MGMKVFVGFLALVSCGNEAKRAKEFDAKKCTEQCDNAFPDALMKCLKKTMAPDITWDFVNCNKQEILNWSSCRDVCRPNICNKKKALPPMNGHVLLRQRPPPRCVERPARSKEPITLPTPIPNQRIPWKVAMRMVQNRLSRKTRRL